MSTPSKLLSFRSPSKEYSDVEGKKKKVVQDFNEPFLPFIVKFEIECVKVSSLLVTYLMEISTEYLPIDATDCSGEFRLSTGMSVLFESNAEFNNELTEGVVLKVFDGVGACVALNSSFTSTMNVHSIQIRFAKTPCFQFAAQENRQQNPLDLENDTDDFIENDTTLFGMTMSMLNAAPESPSKTSQIHMQMTSTMMMTTTDMSTAVDSRDSPFRDRVGDNASITASPIAPQSSTTTTTWHLLRLVEYVVLAHKHSTQFSVHTSSSKGSQNDSRMMEIVLAEKCGVALIETCRALLLDDLFCGDATIVLVRLSELLRQPSHDDWKPSDLLEVIALLMTKKT